MGFFDFILGREPTVKNKQLDGWGYNGVGVTAAGVPVNSFSALQQSAVLACTAILSEDLAKLPLMIFRKLDNGGKKPATDHFLYKILKNPNSWQTRFEFIQMMQACLVIASNAFAVILRDSRGYPTELVPIHPSRVSLSQGGDGNYFYNIGRSNFHDTAILKDTPMKVPSEDVFHLKWLSTIESLWGTARVDLAREAIGLSMALDESTARVVSSAARPGGLLMTEAKIGTEQAAHIVAEFARNHSGANRSGGIGLLESGMTYTPLSYNTVDQEFVSQRSFQLSEVARAFRVPLRLLGVIEAGDKSNEVESDQNYINSTLGPYAENWCSRLMKTFDISDDDYIIEFDFNQYMRADLKTRLESLRAGILGSIYTINEAREALGMARVEDGDIILQATNLAPFPYEPPAPNSPQSGPGSDQTGSPGQNGDGDETAEPRVEGDTAAPNS